MKPVVMCEGKRDVKLVKCYFEQLPRDHNVNTFLGEHVSHSNLSNKEADMIRDFPGRWNPYDVLAKSENGIDDLQTVFVKLAKFLMDQDVDLCLVIDLDCGDVNDFLVDLNEPLQSKPGTNLEATFEERIDRSSALIATKNHLLENGELRGTFDILAFHSDLETETDIDKKNDSKAVQERKLREFLADDHRASPLHRVL